MKYVFDISNVNAVRAGDIMENIIKKNKINLHFRSFIRVNNILYFSEAFFNGLFKMNLEDFSVKFICHFSGENEKKLLLHGQSVIRYEDYIYFFPTCSRRIHYYNFVSNKEHDIIIPISEDKEFVVGSVLQKDNIVWLVSTDLSNGIYVLDMKERTIEKDKTLSAMLQKYQKLTNFIIQKEESKLYTFCVESFTLVEIDLVKHLIDEYNLPVPMKKIISINYNNGKFYFIEEDSGNLYEWIWKSTNIKKFIAQDLDDCLTYGSPFSNCCFIDDDIYMIPFRNKYIMKINKENDSIKRAFVYPKEFQRLKSICNYEPPIISSFEVVCNKIWFYPFGGNQMLVYDIKSGQVFGKEITIGFNEVFNFKGMVPEDDRISLDFFCHNILTKREKGIITGNTMGKRIYQRLI